MLYFKINVLTHEIIESINASPLENYNTKETATLNGKPFLVPVTETVPTYDPATEYLSDPVDAYDYDTNVATRDYTVITKTAEELTQEQLQTDINTLNNYGKDVVLVLVQLVDYLLNNTAMQATDFDPKVRDAYLDIKPIADRIIQNQ